MTKAVTDFHDLWRTLQKILAMIRFSHTLFALPFALLAAVMAWYANTVAEPPVPFRWLDLVGIVLCMVLARSAAMAFNRIVDRKIDAANPRTAGRHLPTGQLSLQSVVIFAIVCSVGFVAATGLFWPNWLPLVCSLPVLGFLLVYSYTKRFTSLAHFWLGASLMLAPVAAWIAIRGEVVLGDPADLLPAVVLGLAVLLWVSGFDIIYACQDAQFDRSAGLSSLPALLSVPVALRVAALCHAATVGMLLLLPVVYPPLGLVYWLGVAAVAALLVYEHWLVKPDDLTRVNLAFFHVNSVISLGMLVVGVIDLLLV